MNDSTGHPESRWNRDEGSLYRWIDLLSCKEILLRPTALLRMTLLRQSPHIASRPGLLYYQSLFRATAQTSDFHREYTEFG